MLSVYLYYVQGPQKVNLFKKDTKFNYLEIYVVLEIGYYTVNFE